MRLFKQSLRLTVSALLLSTAIQASGAPLAIGDNAPDFEVTTLAGKTFRLSDYEGDKPVYLKFWATWCSPCKIEMPTLEAIHKHMNNDKFTVIGIHVGPGPENINNYLKLNIMWMYMLIIDVSLWIISTISR